MNRIQYRGLLMECLKQGNRRGDIEASRNHTNFVCASIDALRQWQFSELPDSVRVGGVTTKPEVVDSERLQQDAFDTLAIPEGDKALFKRFVQGTDNLLKGLVQPDMFPFVRDLLAFYVWSCRLNRFDDARKAVDLVDIMNRYGVLPVRFYHQEKHILEVVSLRR